MKACGAFEVSATRLIFSNKQGVIPLSCYRVLPGKNAAEYKYPEQPI